MASVSYIQAIRAHQSVREVEFLRQLVNAAHRRQDLDNMNFSVSYSPADALKFSVMYGHTEYATHLLHHHTRAALTEQTCCPILFMAIYSRFTDIVRLLCEYSKKEHIEKNGRPYIDYPGCQALENRKIPLQIAMELGANDIVQVLLQHGADLMAANRGQDVLKHSLSVLNSVDGQFLGSNESYADDNESGVWLSLKSLASVRSDWTPSMREDFCAVARWNQQTDEAFPFPVSLQQLCRGVIRRRVGVGRLPVAGTGLPLPLERYVNLQ